MLPGELIIFMAIVESGQLEKQINAPMPITGEYMNCLYNSMVKHGYLTGNTYEGYQVTAKGKAALTESLRGYGTIVIDKNSTIVIDKIGSLKQSVIGISGQEIGEVNKEPIDGNQRMSATRQDANSQQAVVLPDKGWLFR